MATTNALRSCSGSRRSELSDGVSDNLTRLIHAAGREADRNAVAREALECDKLAFEARVRACVGTR